MALPREASVQISQLSLEETIRTMTEVVAGCTLHLIVALDEVGVSEWKDRKTRKALVPLKQE
jgi:hypothetical protein